MSVDTKNAPASSRPPGESAQETPGLSPDSYPVFEEQSRRALVLLVILCLGALGSFSFTPSLQAWSFAAPAARQQYYDGICTAQPQTIHYIQATPASQNGEQVPKIWTDAGKNSRQFTLAQACVAAFTSAYQSLSIDRPTTLSSAVSMLSAVGKKHFFEGTRNEPGEPRLDAGWQARARQEHLRQSVQLLDKAQLQAVQANGDTFSALFVINYALTSTLSGKSTTQHKQLVVTLSAVPLSREDTSTGWQVTDWHDYTLSVS